jgi:hypothetical protein
MECQEATSLQAVESSLNERFSLNNAGLVALGLGDPRSQMHVRRTGVRSGACGTASKPHRGASCLTGTRQGNMDFVPYMVTTPLLCSASRPGMGGARKRAILQD